MKDTIIKARPGFQETVRASTALYMLAGLLLGGGLGIITGFAVLEILGRGSIAGSASIFLYVIGFVIAAIALVVLNGLQMDIVVNKEGLECKQGITRKRIPWSQIERARPVDKSPPILSKEFIVGMVAKKVVWKVPLLSTGVEVVVTAELLYSVFS